MNQDVIKGETNKYRTLIHILSCCEAHTIAENIVSACINDVISCVLGQWRRTG